MNGIEVMKIFALRARPRLRPTSCKDLKVVLVTAQIGRSGFASDFVCPSGRSQLAVFLRCSLGPYDSDMGARSRLEKQPTDFRQNICYFGDRTLDRGCSLR